MPSARELLEQADALMRRNRSPLMDDIPVLTDSVPEVSQARPLREKPLPESNAPDTIPMLTESVSPADSAPVAPHAGAKGAVVEEGEPSDWLQTGGREPSVIGEAPDSIVIVPAVVHEIHEEIVVEAPPEVEEAFDEELAQRAGVSTPPAPESLPWEEDTVIDAPKKGALEEEDEIVPVEIAPVEAAALPVAEPPVPPLPLADAGPSAAERKAEEDARWAAMAEEIRMQVLQRIDLFTDTGLRDQLGARLQPIVDRASADLVATINQHVGELLRSYVAEAIEREIDNWKRNN